MDNTTDRNTGELRKPDFGEMILMLRSLSNVAQATFLARYAQVLSPSLCLSGLKYFGMRLDELNSQLPLDSPHRQRYEERKQRLLLGDEAFGAFNASPEQKLSTLKEFEAAKPEYVTSYDPYASKMPIEGNPYASFKSADIYVQDPIPEPWGKYGPYSPQSKDNPQEYADRRAKYLMTPAEAFRAQNIAYGVVKNKLESLITKEMKKEEHGTTPLVPGKLYGSPAVMEEINKVKEEIAAKEEAHVLWGKRNTDEEPEKL